MGQDQVHNEAIYAQAAPGAAQVVRNAIGTLTELRCELRALELDAQSAELRVDVGFELALAARDLERMYLLLTAEPQAAG